MGLGHDVQVRLLALAVVFLVVVGGVTAVVRGGGPSPAPALVLGAGERSDAGLAAALGQAPDDQLPLSQPQTLDLAAAGYDLPAGGSVYAARVVDSADGPRYVDYVAGGGALADDFWPASSIKVLAALGALDFVASLGFSGAATVSFDSGYPVAGDGTTIREIYDSAVHDSDNLDYDVLIRIAGFDRLNDDFLSPANGFPTTVIQRSYAGIDVRWSPEMTLRENGRVVVVPERSGRGEYGCPVDGNCSNLFEMSESLRRLVLDRTLPPGERFGIDPLDVQALSRALLGTDSFLEAGVESVLGPSATVRSKPGVADGLECVDTAVVTAPGGDHYLLSAAIPMEDFECGGLSDLAAAVLPLLART